MRQIDPRAFHTQTGLVGLLAGSRARRWQRTASLVNKMVTLVMRSFLTARQGALNFSKNSNFEFYSVFKSI
jgi:hypothetical protein